MPSYLVAVSARKHGTIGEFENFELTVDGADMTDPEDDHEARRTASQRMIDRGYETNRASVIKEWF